MPILHGIQPKAVRKCISTRVMSPRGFHGIPCSNHKLLHEKWIEQTKQSTLLGTNNLSHTHSVGVHLGDGKYTKPRNLTTTFVKWVYCQHWLKKHYTK